VVYDKVFLAIKGVSLEIREGDMVALLGANGAGKSTTLKSVSGLLAPERGEVTRGHIEFAGRDLGTMPAPQRVHLGIAHVLEGRRVFGHLTPEENLTPPTGGATSAATCSCETWSMVTSRAWSSGRNRRRAISPAESSRCWPSAGR